MGFGRKNGVAPGWTALVFNQRRIDVTRVAQRLGQRPLIETLESYAREGDDAQSLSRLRKKYALADARCTTLLAPGSYQLVQIETPDVPAADVRPLVGARLKESLDYPVEHATFDLFDIPASATTGARAHMSYAVVAPNAALAPQIQAFQGAGVPLDVIDIPEMAQRNIARLCETTGRGLAFLTFDETGGILTLTAGGELYAVRRIEISLDQLQKADEARRAELFDRVGLEVQRSLDNFDRQYSAIPVNRLLLGPQPLAPDMLAFLGSYLSLPVDVLDLAQIADFPAVPELNQPGRQAQCLQAIGAALREAESA